MQFCIKNEMTAVKFPVNIGNLYKKFFGLLKFLIKATAEVPGQTFHKIRRQRFDFFYFIDPS